MERQWIAHVDQVFLSVDNLIAQSEVIQIPSFTAKGKTTWMKISKLVKQSPRIMLDQIEPVHKGNARKLTQQGLHALNLWFLPQCAITLKCWGQKPFKDLLYIAMNHLLLSFPMD